MEYEWRHSGLEGTSRLLMPIPETRGALQPAPFRQAPRQVALRPAWADQTSVVSEDNSLFGGEPGAALSGSPGRKGAKDAHEEDAAAPALPASAGISATTRYALRPGLGERKAPAVSNETSSRPPMTPQTHRTWWDSNRPNLILHAELEAEGIEINCDHKAHLCKYTKRPKYECKLSANERKLEWVYSVPCGDCADKPEGSWIFFECKDVPEENPKKQQAITAWLESIHWKIITNSRTKRFQCPTCAGTQEGMPT